MTESEDSSQNRTDALRELDIYERVQVRILDWARRRFWLTAVVITALLGSTGIIAINTTVGASYVTRPYALAPESSAVESGRRSNGKCRVMVSAGVCPA